MAFTFGGVFTRFFKLIGENFAPLLIIGLLFTVAPTVAMYYGLFSSIGVSGTNWPTQIGAMGPTGYGILGGGVLVIAVLNLISLCAITEIAILGAVGKKAVIGRVLAHALGNCIPVLIIGIIVAILSGLLAVLLIIPGIMFMLAAYVAIPAYVGQPEVGLWGAVKRSFDLTRNHRWGILGLIIVLGLISGTVGGALGGTAGMIIRSTDSLPFSIVQGLINGFSSVISQIFVAAIYVCLRQSKEKTMPETAAAVFE